MVLYYALTRFYHRLRGVKVHPLALIERGVEIGRGTRVWANAHILTGARVGEDCNICDGVFIEGGARVGNCCTLKCGVYLWDGITLEDYVFVGPNGTFTNDKWPISRRQVTPARTLVLAGTSIGAGAVILPGLIVGKNSMVAAGAVVVHDVAPLTTVAGNPARRIEE